MKKFLSILFLSFLCSCTTRTDFDCKPQKGKKACSTIAQADENIEQRKSVASSQPVITSLAATEKDDSKVFTTIRTLPERTEEKRGKLWFAPFVDEEGNFYDEAYVYLIFEPAKWQIKKPHPMKKE